MTKYRVTIEEVTEYPETSRKYEAADGKRYTSSYDLDKDTYKTVDVPTGAMLQKEREIYVQDFEAADLKAIIKAVNQI